jgi:hypothetical protein
VGRSDERLKFLNRIGAEPFKSFRNPKDYRPVLPSIGWQCMGIEARLRVSV